MRALLILINVFIVAVANGAEPPTTQPIVSVSVGKMNVDVYPPDVTNGHYRGTRFDWSGMIGRVVYDGHVFWEEWNPSTDATGDHDNAVGPAMEFGMDRPVGFEEAKPGEGFVKIGVGVLKKPDDGKPYFFRRKYVLLDPGRWSFSRAGPNGSELHFEHVLDGPAIRYTYKKRVSVTENSIAIHCALTNRGDRPIKSEVYNHNFFRLGAKDVAPPLEIEFDKRVTLDPKSKLGDAAKMQDAFKVIAPLTKSLWAPLITDPPASLRSFTMTKDALKLKVSQDFEASKYVIYGLPAFISVEPFLLLSIEPGKTTAWTYTYEFEVTQ